jgi:hypothetical protein
MQVIENRNRFIILYIADGIISDNNLSIFAGMSKGDFIIDLTYLDLSLSNTKAIK